MTSCTERNNATEEYFAKPKKDVAAFCFGIAGAGLEDVGVPATGRRDALDADDLLVTGHESAGSSFERDGGGCACVVKRKKN